MQTYHYSSPIGNLKLEGSEKGIYRVIFTKEPSAAQADIPQDLQICVKQLNEYFESKRLTFDLPLDFSTATDFEQQVWNTLLEIPYGETTSYSDIANKLNNPKAVRAVGTANGRNRMMIIVPCHRVIGKDGSMTGYAHGIEIKKQLLAHENPQRFAENQLSLF